MVFGWVSEAVTLTSRSKRSNGRALVRLAEQLERGGAAQERVPGQIDLAHRAAAQLAFEDVFAETAGLELGLPRPAPAPARRAPSPATAPSPITASSASSAPKIRSSAASGSNASVASSSQSTPKPRSASQVHAPTTGTPR